MSRITERFVTAAGVRTRVAYKPGAGTPIVFWHGNPTNGDDWIPFMEKTERPCFAADLPGFGRSGRPSVADFAYGMDDYGRWASKLVAELDLDAYDCVVHDWGSIGLLAAQGDPGRVRRLVALNCVPFGVSYEWHWIARWFWRRRGLGEAFNRGTSPRATALVLRQARARWKPMPDRFVECAQAAIADPVTSEAVLRLYRSADHDALERAGAGLADLACPTLILWGSQDPYIPVTYGRRLAGLLPSANLIEVEGAGHWPWIDRPDLIATALRHLGATTAEE